MTLLGGRVCEDISRGEYLIILKSTGSQPTTQGVWGMPAVCVERRGKELILERSFVRVSCCVSNLVVDMECNKGIVRAYGGVNEDVAIDYVTGDSFSSETDPSLLSLHTTQTDN